MDEAAAPAARHRRLGPLQARPRGRPRLVDEAQDTNAAQWEIIEKLVEEYFSGSSETEERRRTLFMVGDFKQAIYGFQGTDPTRFSEAREHFKRRAEELTRRRGHARPVQAPHTEFRDLSIAASFRSAQPVLDVVDAVIAVAGSRSSSAGRAAAARTSRITETVPARSSCGSRSRLSSTRRATKARRAGSRCARGNMPKRWPSGSASSSDEAPYLASTESSADTPATSSCSFAAAASSLR